MLVLGGLSWTRQVVRYEMVSGLVRENMIVALEFI